MVLASCPQTVYISMMMMDDGKLACGIQCVVVCVQLLEACVSNCGKDFQLELTKPAFQSDARAILTGVSTGVTSLVSDVISPSLHV